MTQKKEQEKRPKTLTPPPRIQVCGTTDFPNAKMSSTDFVDDNDDDGGWIQSPLKGEPIPHCILVLLQYATDFREAQSTGLPWLQLWRKEVLSLKMKNPGTGGSGKAIVRCLLQYERKQSRVVPGDD